MPRHRKINRSVTGINHTKCPLIPKKRLVPMTLFRRTIVPTSSSPAISPHDIDNTTEKDVIAMHADGNDIREIRHDAGDRVSDRVINKSRS
jgi:hypothetical protein